MSPPPYRDLGKSLRDLLSKGYHIGFVRLESNTINGPLSVKSVNSHNIETDKFVGTVDLKHKIPEYGVSITPKLSTEGKISTELIVEDQLAKGVKLTFDSNFAQAGGQKSGAIKSEYVTDNANINIDAIFANSAKLPELSLSAVIGNGQFVGGFHVLYDTAAARLTKHSVGVSYKTGGATVHAFANDGTQFGASCFQALDRTTEFGVEMGYSAVDQRARFVVGAKYMPQYSKQIYRAKISNNSELTVGLTHELAPGLKFTAAALFNVAHLGQRGPKIGIGLEYEN